MNRRICLLLGAALSSALTAQNVLLPDNHHLGKSQAQVFASGSTNWWGTTASTTGRRFQVLYDASHFTVVGGVNNPITITNVRFRGEDTEHNRGGQTFTGVTASIYATTLTSAAALSTTWGTNTAPGVATLLGTVTIPTLTAAPATGKAPNDYVIDLNFAGVPMLAFDPTSARPNFLLEVTWQSSTVGPAPELSNMMQIQDTAGTTALIRGRGLYATSVGAATGTATTTPPVLHIAFTGAGGYPVLTPATNERFGGACGGQPSAFYELFAHNQYFDLRDPAGASSITLTPDQYPDPNFYTVTRTAVPVDVANGVVGAPINIVEDSTVPYALPGGLAFDFPGNPGLGTTAIRPSSNGYVILDPTSTETGSDFSPTVDEFLGVTAATNLARMCPFWHDFSPNKNIAIDPLSGQYAVVSAANPSQVLVTWYRVGRFNSVAQPGQEYHTMQLMLDCATGQAEFRYGPMDEIWGDTFTTSTVTGGVSGITGFTRGRIAGVASVNPQSRDLSNELPAGPFPPQFRTQIEGAAGNMGQAIVAGSVVAGPVYGGRAFYGQSLTLNASNVPAGSAIGLQLISNLTTSPGLQLPGITGPGCMLSLISPLVWEVNLFPAASVTGTVPFAIPAAGYPGFLGSTFGMQYVTLDLTPGATLLPATSNAFRMTVGLQ